MKTFYNLSLWLTVAAIFHISCIVPATAWGPGVRFDTAPYVYATPDSGTYTRTRKMQGSLIYSETWSPLKPKKAAVKIATVVSGLGEMSVDFSSSLGDAAYAGLSIGWATTSLGKPVYQALSKAPLVYEASGDFPSLEPGTTSPWNGSGSITLVALVWRDSGSGSLPPVVSWGGSWSNGTSVTKKAENSGEWTIADETKVQCGNSSCNKGGWVDTANEHYAPCTGCGTKIWTCQSGSFAAHIVVITDGPHRHFESRCAKCGKNFWVCVNDPIRYHTTETCPVCSATYEGCTGGHNCPGDGSSGSGSSSGGGSTPPATTPSTGGGGGGSDTRVRCGHGNACSLGGYASSREAHKITCPAGHRYYKCSATGNSRHANCRARQSGEVACARGSWCRSGGYASSRNAHRTTCGRGHTYWSCSPSAVRRHRGH